MDLGGGSKGKHVLQAVDAAIKPENLAVYYCLHSDGVVHVSFLAEIGYFLVWAMSILS